MAQSESKALTIFNEIKKPATASAGFGFFVAGECLCREPPRAFFFKPLDPFEPGYFYRCRDDDELVHQEVIIVICRICRAELFGERTQLPFLNGVPEERIVGGEEIPGLRPFPHGSFLGLISSARCCTFIPSFY